MNMWRLYFEVYDFVVRFIPNRKLRENIRRKELYDYRKKFNALKSALGPKEFKHVRIIKGGWNIGFIVDNKYVCKIRKYYDKDIPVDKIMREKRITDAFGPIVPIRIPKIDIIETCGYTFYRYNFIPGKNLNQMPLRTIIKNGWRWGKQLAEFIDAMQAIGTWMYMKSALGSGPRDALMVVLARKTKRSVGICRITVEIIAIIAGWLMGGQVGIGTVITGVGVGTLFNLNFALLHFKAADLHQENLPETIQRIRSQAV